MKKTIAWLLILVLVVNIVLFALGKINALMFWLIIIVAAVVAYKVLPNLSHGKNKK